MARLKVTLILMLLPLIFAGAASAQDRQTHVVLPGENLFRIAESYGVSVNSIAEANDIANTWRIYVGQSLIIPTLNADGTSSIPNSAPAGDDVPIIVRPANSPADAPAVASDQPLEYYTVSNGQSLAQIAKHYNQTVEQIAQLNNITNPNMIYAGQQLIVSGNPASAPAEAPAAPPEQPLQYHTVSDGESLAQIAEQYNQTVEQIAQLNNITNPNRIYAGQSLIVSGSPASALTTDTTYSTVADSAPSAGSAPLPDSAPPMVRRPSRTSSSAASRSPRLRPTMAPAI